MLNTTAVNKSVELAGMATTALTNRTIDASGVLVTNTLPSGVIACTGTRAGLWAQFLRGAYGAVAEMSGSAILTLQPLVSVETKARSRSPITVSRFLCRAVIVTKLVWAQLAGADLCAVDSKVKNTTLQNFGNRMQETPNHMCSM